MFFAHSLVTPNEADLRGLNFEVMDCTIYFTL